jgi:hypothetical protein
MKVKHACACGPCREIGFDAAGDMGLAAKAFDKCAE